MFFLENQQLKISIHPKGAELQAIFHKDHQLDYMWSGDPAFWGKHSPLLFPIVGTLKSNTYYYQDKPYSLTRHGFARDRDFVVESQSADAITFLLRSDDSTRANYPFDFELRIIYRLTGGDISTAVGLSTTYQVKNPSKQMLYFSIGGHPAFSVPLVPGTDYNDYYLEFDRPETTPRWPISKDGLIEHEPQAAAGKYPHPSPDQRAVRKRCTRDETPGFFGRGPPVCQDGKRTAAWIFPASHSWVSGRLPERISFVSNPGAASPTPSTATSNGSTRKGSIAWKPVEYSKGPGC